MARIVNAVIGKKNKTWCDNFMLEAMPTLRLIPLPSLALNNPSTGGLNHYQTGGLRLIHIKFISFIHATQYSRYKLDRYRLLSVFS